MHRASRIACGLAWLIGSACGSPPPSTQAAAEPAPPQPSAGAERPAAPYDGLWVEYWAIDGHADTQRYELFPDGRFGWSAARNGPEQGARRWGRWSTEGETLVLHVQGRDAGPGCQGESCRVQLDPPQQERLQLGACPPNEEARALDASYRCISIAGQAFWRRAQAGDPSDYFAD